MLTVLSLKFQYSTHKNQDSYEASAFVREVEEVEEESKDKKHGKLVLSPVVPCIMAIFGVWMKYGLQHPKISSYELALEVEYTSQQPAIFNYN